MSKRKSPSHRSPGPLSPFSNGEEAAERLAVLDDISDRFARWEQEKPTMEPLAELSELLGVEIVDVRRGARLKHRSGVAGLHQPKVWQFTTASGVRSSCFTSDDLRREDRLNELGCYWGRPPGLPRLASKDGRTVLRLMHEHVESKNDTKEDER